MSEPTRLDFLVYYRKQLQIICDKIDKQIEKTGGKMSVGDKKLLEGEKDLTDRKFLDEYVNYQGLLEVFDQCREYLKSISNVEQAGDGRLLYSNPKLGERFAMIALAPNHLNLYIAPRLGLYDNLPQEAMHELRFGKSQGDRWDKFQLTTKYQVEKAIAYLKPFLTPSEGSEDQKAESTIHASPEAG